MMKRKYQKPEQTILFCENCNIKIKIESTTFPDSEVENSVKEWEDYIGQSCPICDYLLFKDFEESTIERDE